MRITAILAILCLFLFIPENTKCQVNSILYEIESSLANQGKIKIVQENSIKTVLERHQWEQSRQNGIEGYRIRIFSDSGPNAKSAFEETKARFISFYEEVKIHESFVYPNYKLYVGDFRTKSEALKILTTIEAQFPDAFIVQTKINLPNY